jgi:hypothetical protein
VTEVTCGFTCWLTSKSEVGLDVTPILVSGVEQERGLFEEEAGLLGNCYETKSSLVFTR